MISKEIAEELMRKSNPHFKGCPECGVIPAEFYVSQELDGELRYFVIYICMKCKNVVLLKYYDKNTLEEIESKTVKCANCESETTEGLKYCTECLKVIKNKIIK